MLPKQLHSLNELVCRVWHNVWEEVNHREGDCECQLKSVHRRARAKTKCRQGSFNSFRSQNPVKLWATDTVKHSKSCSFWCVEDDFGTVDVWRLKAGAGLGGWGAGGWGGGQHIPKFRNQDQDKEKCACFFHSSCLMFQGGEIWNTDGRLKRLGPRQCNCCGCSTSAEHGELSKHLTHDWRPPVSGGRLAGLLLPWKKTIHWDVLKLEDHKSESLFQTLHCKTFDMNTRQIFHNTQADLRGRVQRFGCSSRFLWSQKTCGPSGDLFYWPAEQKQHKAPELCRGWKESEAAWRGGGGQPPVLRLSRSMRSAMKMWCYGLKFWLGFHSVSFEQSSPSNVNGPLPGIRSQPQFPAETQALFRWPAADLHPPCSQRRSSWPPLDRLLICVLSAKKNWPYDAKLLAISSLFLSSPAALPLFPPLAPSFIKS